jgi:hypothetical protein
LRSGERGAGELAPNWQGGAEAGYGGRVSEAMQDGRVFRDQTVRLSDLAVLEDIIDGVTIESCEIHGPAVVALLGNTQITGCHWSGDADGIIWPAHGREQVVGAIGLKDCFITDSQFFRVGVLVPDEQMAAVRAGFGLD